MTSELTLYRPYTVDAAKLKKHEEEDKIFQLLASLGSKYEDLHIKILMNPDFQSFISVCATIQWEEARINVMNFDSKILLSQTRVYAINKSMNNDGPYKETRPDLKWYHYHNIGHSIRRCWIFHPELKLNFKKKKKSQRGY